MIPVVATTPPTELRLEDLVGPLGGQVSGPPQEIALGDPPPDASGADAAILAAAQELQADRWRSSKAIFMPSVRATATLQTDGTIPVTPPAQAPRAFDPTTLRSCPWVKWSISSPQWSGPCWIDLDRAMVVPSRLLGADLWAIPDFAVDPPPDREFLPTAAGYVPANGYIWWDVWITYNIGRVHVGAEGLPILTTWVNLSKGARNMVVPRGARRLWVSAGSGATISVLFFAGSGTAISNMGGGSSGAVVQGYEVAIMPDATAVQVSSVSPTFVSLAWEIQP